MIKILILEDNNIDAKLARIELKHAKIDYTSKLVITKEDFEESILSYQPDLILSDYSLPDYDGLSALLHCRENIPEIPFIFFTGAMDEETAVKSMKAGAWDYVLKDNIIRLAPAVKNALKLKKEKNEIKQLQNSLLAKDTMINNLIENLPGIAFKGEFNQCLTVEYISSGCYKLTGYYPEDFIQNKELSYFSIIHSDDQDAVQKEIEKAIKNKAGYQIEYRIITASGAEKWFWEKGNSDETEGKVVLEGYISDITARKKAELELKRSEDKFRTFAENVPGVVNIYNWYPDGHRDFIYQGPGLEEIVGKELCNKINNDSELFFKLIHPDDRIALEEKAVKAMNSDHQLEAEYRLVLGENNTKWIRVRFNLFPNEDGMISWHGLIFEITKEKKIQQELIESKEQFLQFMNLVPAAAYIKDEESRLIFANKYMTQYLVPENYLDKAPEDYHTAEFAEKIRRYDEDTLLVGTMDYEDSFPNKFGKLRHYDVHRFVIWGDGSNPLICGLAVDITKRLIAEKTQEVLFYIANAVNTTHDLHELYEKIREQLGQIFDTTNFLVALVDKKSSKIAISYIKDKKNISLKYVQPNSFGEYVLKTGKPLLITMDVRRKLFEKKGLMEIGVASKIWMGAPLKMGGEVVGIVAARGYDDPNLYSQADLDVLAFVSEEIALAIEQKRADDQIRSDLEEKEVLIKEVHHRVKNNMQIISSMLKLQSRHITDPVALKLFKNSQDRVRSMALIHERIYRSKDLVSVDFGDYVNTLIRSLIINYNVLSNNLKLDLKCKGVNLKMDDAIPLGLIVNELVSNALKHGLKDNSCGAIRVYFNQEEDGDYTLIVANDGKADESKINFDNPATLGLQLVKALTSQLHGNVRCECTEETKFILTFKGRQ